MTSADITQPAILSLPTTKETVTNTQNSLGVAPLVKHNQPTFVAVGGDFTLIMSHNDRRLLRSLLSEPSSVFISHHATANTLHSWQLSTLAKAALHEQNAGGGSELSESLSVEILSRLFPCVSIKTEMQITYKVYGGKIADYLAAVKVGETSIKIGVSVARAMHPLKLNHKRPRIFDEAEADRLMYKKVNGLICARSGVHRSDRFYTSIVHFQAQTDEIAELMHAAYKRLEPRYREDIIVLVTICEGSGFDCMWSNCETCCNEC